MMMPIQLQLSVPKSMKLSIIVIVILLVAATSSIKWKKNKIQARSRTVAQACLQSAHWVGQDRLAVTEDDIAVLVSAGHH
uniref:Uncharacterized protein n=1 Tax=Romanomermis culicivorax TaxID=13658 RepID=A0A915KZN1_ROMCU